MRMTCWTAALGGWSMGWKGPVMEGGLERASWTQYLFEVSDDDGTWLRNGPGWLEVTDSSSFKA